MHYNEALENCIFRYTSGSHQYGTNRPDSDIDKRGVFVAPLNYCFDLFHSSFVGSGTIKQTLDAARERIEAGDLPRALNLIADAQMPDRGDLNIGVETVSNPNEQDEELQELRKFLKLAADCNPNIIEFLYVEDLIDICKPEWEEIREARDLFLSKKARWTFAGYAIAQLRRIKMHRGYLLNPPSHKPTRKEFGLGENSNIKPEHRNAIMILPDEWITASAKEEVLREKQYSSAMANWNSYAKWERERNAARREMEKKYGFDVKHAGHLIRLCRMAKEILRDGVVLVRRPDAEELKGILRGEWTYEQVLAVTENMDEELDALYAASPLRQKPDHNGISELYRKICDKRYFLA
jgi:predicted nucleotidyltransferase